MKDCAFLSFIRCLWPSECDDAVFSLFPGRGSMAKPLPFALVHGVRMFAGAGDVCRAFRKLYLDMCSNMVTPGHTFIF